MPQLPTSTKGKSATVSHRAPHPASQPGQSAQGIAFWLMLIAALAYCLWLGAHWLPLDWSDKELSASASRVWDIKTELTKHGHLPWWTPYYMSGSSYGINYSRGLYLLPWLLFSTFTSLQVAGKLMALTAMFTSAVAMYFCARHFTRHHWAAALAALVYLFHPEQLTRAATQEHMTIILFFPFVPLLWLTFARALESGRFRNVFWCALTATAAMLADNKQAFVLFMFLFFYLLFWLWRPERRHQWRTTLRTCLVLAALTAPLAAASIVPAAMEARYVKLFIGDPLEGWQRTFSLKSPLALVDRNGALTRHTVQSVLQRVQSGGYQVHSETEATVLRQEIQSVLLLQMDSPEKYAGIVLLVLIACAVLFNARRENRRLFWFCIGMLLVSVILAAGLDNVWTTTWNVFSVLLGLDGVPSATRLAVMLTTAAGFAALILFAKRKLTTRRKWIFAGAVLAAFLFLPVFRILAVLPYFKEIRAPAVFYAMPFAFFGALVAGFFVTDVLTVEKWRTRTPLIVTGLGVLLLFDYWPYQQAMKQTGVPERTIRNLGITYSALKQDTDWVKTYAVSGRYFHLLGPMWSGKPQVWEAFYNWMAPLGTGLLNQKGGGSREVLNLFAARYIVFDKTDPDMQSPQMQQTLAVYRKTYPVFTENEDFVVFRNDAAHPYVTGYARACLFDGDIRASAELSLALAAHNWPLVHGTASPDAVVKYNTIYRAGEPATAPSRDAEIVSLADLQLVRENAQRIRIRLNAPRDCLAVIAESYYPYWRGEVDGKPTEVLRVSCALMGVNVPAGTHEIVLHYEPPWAYAVAGVISLLALVGCGLAAWRIKS